MMFDHTSLDGYSRYRDDGLGFPGGGVEVNQLTVDLAVDACRELDDELMEATGQRPRVLMTGRVLPMLLLREVDVDPLDFTPSWDDAQYRVGRLGILRGYELWRLLDFRRDGRPMVPANELLVIADPDEQFNPVGPASPTAHMPIVRRFVDTSIAS